VGWGGGGCGEGGRCRVGSRVCQAADPPPQLPPLPLTRAWQAVPDPAPLTDKGQGSLRPATADTCAAVAAFATYRRWQTLSAGGLCPAADAAQPSPTRPPCAWPAPPCPASADTAAAAAATHGPGRSPSRRRLRRRRRSRRRRPARSHCRADSGWHLSPEPEHVELSSVWPAGSGPGAGIRIAATARIRESLPLAKNN
jgi:hypothetical protein